MKRLVVFGCSHTYGTALPDILGENKLGTPSNLAWPSVLSKDLGLELVNKSFPGWSNHRILHEILSFDFNADDVVVILWTTPNREMIYLDDKSQFHIGYWNDDETTKAFYMLHTDLDFAIRNLLYIHHADIIMKLKRLTGKHFLFVNNKSSQAIPIAKKECSWFNSEIKNLHMPSIVVDMAEDNAHFGVKTHKAISAYIKQSLKEILNDTKY